MEKSSRKRSYMHTGSLIPSLDEGKHVYHISWSSFVYLLEGIIRKEKDEYFDEYEDEKIDGEELQESV